MSSPVGASLLAKAQFQSTFQLPDPPHSRAGSLPHWYVPGTQKVYTRLSPSVPFMCALSVLTPWKVTHSSRIPICLPLCKLPPLKKIPVQSINLYRLFFSHLCGIDNYSKW